MITRIYAAEWAHLHRWQCLYDPMLRTVALAEDDHALRELLRALLTERGHKVHAFGSASELVGQLREILPDVVVVDLDLGPGPSGVDVLRAVEAVVPSAACMVLSWHRSPQLVDHTINRIPTDIHYMVKADFKAEEFLRWVEAAHPQPPRPRRMREDLPVITSTQAELLRMMAMGMSNRAIAKERGTGVRSVEQLCQRLYSALGLTDMPEVDMRTTAVRMYRESGMRVR